MVKGVIWNFDDETGHRRLEMKGCLLNTIHNE